MTLNADALAKPDAVSDAEARAALRAAEGPLRHAGAPDHPADRLPDQEEAEAAFSRIKDGDDLRGGRGRARHLRPGSRTRHLHQGRDVRPGRRRRRLLAAGGRGERPGPRAASDRSSSASPKFSPRPSGPSRRSRARVKQELAQERAKEGIDAAARRDRGPARWSPAAADIAKEKNLAARPGPGRRRGMAATRPGKPVEDLPERDALVAAAFASDIGVDNEPLRIRRRRLRLVRRDRDRAGPRKDPRRGPRTRSSAQWRDDEVAQRLAEKAPRSGRAARQGRGDRGRREEKSSAQ